MRKWKKNCLALAQKSKGLKYDFKRPFVLGVALFLSGIIARDLFYKTGFSHVHYPSVSLVLAGILSLGLHRLYRYLSILLFAMFIFLLAGILTPVPAPPFQVKCPEDNLKDNPVYKDITGTRIITGIIKGAARRSTDRVKVVVKTLSIDGRIQPDDNIRIILTIGSYYRPWLNGDRIRFKAKIKPVKGFKNKGIFDYEAYMARQSIFLKAYIASDKEIENYGPFGFLSTLLNITDRMRWKFQGLCLDELSPEAAGFLCALTTGEKNLMPKYLKDMAYSIGIGHLFAVSGLHLGIVAMWGVLLAGIFTRFFVFPLKKMGRPAFAALAGLPLVIFYGIFTGLSISTQRAMILVISFFTGMLLSRRGDPYTTLALACIIILLHDSGAWMAYGFQFSFMAVLTIIYIVEKISFKDNETNVAIVWIDGLWKTSIAAFIATAPLAAMHFNRISFIGILINPFVITFVTLFSLPLGLFTLLVSWISPQAATWILMINGLAIDACISVFFRIRDIPMAWNWVAGPGIVSIFLFFSACFFLISRYPALKKRPEPLLLLFLIFPAEQSMFHLLNQNNNNLNISVLDVGRGSANVLMLPYGGTVVIDGGGSPWSEMDYGETITAPFLWQNHVPDIDLLISTSPAHEYMGGLLFIAKHFKIKEFWHGPVTANDCWFNEIIKTLSSKGTIIHGPGKIPDKIDINGVVFQNLNPAFKKMPVVKKKNIKNSGLAIRVLFKEKSIIFPSATGNLAQKRMVEVHGNRLDSNILIAPDHASPRSLNKDFLQTIDPDIIIVPNRPKGNAPAIPLKTMALFKKTGSKIIDTFNSGGIDIKISNTGIVSVNTAL